MGNCQAAEVATAIIQHPGGTVERLYFPVTARDVMASNPGHYVAVYVVPREQNRDRARQRHLKLLRPDDTLHIGDVYRLVTFEEVLKEFAAKKNSKLSRLILKQKEREGENKAERRRASNHGDTGSTSRTTLAMAMRSTPPEVSVEDEEVEEQSVGIGMGLSGMGRRHNGGQWRPMLQTIAEVIGD